MYIISSLKLSLAYNFSVFALNPRMYDLIRHAWAVHARIGWFESGTRNFIYPPKKEGQPAPYFISDGNVHANLRGINFEEKCISASLCISVGHARRIYRALRKKLRAFTEDLWNFTYTRRIRGFAWSDELRKEGSSEHFLGCKGTLSHQWRNHKNITR